MPKGGRKGGAIFPRVPLEDAVSYAKKLVAKTHVQAQPIDVIYSGVVGAKTGRGAIRMSALKQYGLMKGTKEDGFSATELAKQITSAPSDELDALYRQAALRPAIFKALFDTYQSDSVTRAKLKQRSADLKVHPEETETCVDVYTKSFQLAKLLEIDGEQITHKAAAELPITESVSNESPDADEGKEDQNGHSTSELATQTAKESVVPAELDAGQDRLKPRAVFNVNVTLDSSLDTEKLAKQLELLKRFGAI